jgi:DNA primase
MSGDETQWLTYRQAADKLGVSPQAVRQKSIRGRWPRTKGNDGQARVQVPEQPYRVRTVSGQAPDVSLVDALREHVATLKADAEKLEALLATERQRADKAIAGVEALVATESARADRAISAFEQLAQRLEELAEATRPSWWRWLRFCFAD